MADDHFAGLPQPRADVAELAIAVRRLVQVHEVHVDRVPGQIAIELRVQMGQRLFQRLQSGDPHLRRRKRVHPADHAEATVRGVCLAARLENRLGRGHDLVKDDRHRQAGGSVQPGDDLAAVGRHLPQRPLAIKMLAAG